MRLSSSVLGVLRGGVATASLMFTVACGTTAEPIQGQPAATLAPVAATPVAAPPIALPPPPPATLLPSAPIELTPVPPLSPAPTAPVAPARRRRPTHHQLAPPGRLYVDGPAVPAPVVRQHPVSINVLPPQPYNVHPNCGRG